VINPLLPATLLQMANPEISERLQTLVVYPRYEDSESKRRDDEAGSEQQGKRLKQPSILSLNHGEGAT